MVDADTDVVDADDIGVDTGVGCYVGANCDVAVAGYADGYAEYAGCYANDADDDVVSVVVDAEIWCRRLCWCL